jgi:hypothetical protein
MSIDDGYITVGISLHDRASGNRIKVIKFEDYKTPAEFADVGYPMVAASFAGTAGTSGITLSNGVSFTPPYKNANGQNFGFPGGFMEGMAFSFDAADGGYVRLGDDIDIEVARLVSRRGRAAVEHTRAFSPTIKVFSNSGTGSYRLVIWGV